MNGFMVSRISSYQTHKGNMRQSKCPIEKKVMIFIYLHQSFL
jgi:hypothetical protein